MIFGFQIIGLMFGLFMLYMTFLYYKKANYDKRGLIFWFAVWGGFIVLALFPRTIYGLMNALDIERTADFFYISGFLFFSVVLFYVYNTAKKNQKQLEIIVRKLAIRDAEKEEKKRR